LNVSPLTDYLSTHKRGVKAVQAIVVARWLREGRYPLCGASPSTDPIPAKAIADVTLSQDVCGMSGIIFNLFS